MEPNSGAIAHSFALLRGVASFTGQFDVEYLSLFLEELYKKISLIYKLNKY